MRYRKGEFILVPNKSAMQDLKPTTQCVWMWLSSYSDGYGQCWPSRELLRKNIGAKSIRTVDVQLKILENLGWIEKTKRYSGEKQQSNMYQLNLVGRGVKSAPLKRKEGCKKLQIGVQKTTHRTKPLTNKGNQKKKLQEMRENLKVSGVIT